MPLTFLLKGFSKEDRREAIIKSMGRVLKSTAVEKRILPASAPGRRKIKRGGLGGWEKGEKKTGV